MATETPHRTEKTWPVLLYRRESIGWKKLETSSLTSSKENEIVFAAPRKDCIVFPDLRQRFSLKGSTDQGTVIRRDDKILLVTKRRARALLLHFQTLEDCLAFSDNFVRLNPRPSLLLSSINAKMIECIMSLNGSQQHNNNFEERIVGDKEHREVVSWIVKMLHDKYFLNYVEKIEKYIAETEDGMRMLQGMEQNRSI